jgi:hypothetical protein
MAGCETLDTVTRDPHFGQVAWAVRSPFFWSFSIPKGPPTDCLDESLEFETTI